MYLRAHHAVSCEYELRGFAFTLDLSAQYLQRLVVNRNVVVALVLSDTDFDNLIYWNAIESKVPLISLIKGSKSSIQC